MKAIIRKILNMLGYELHKLSRVESLFGKSACLDFNKTNSVREMLFSYCLEQSKDFFFIQIGANDGKMCDEIYDFIQRNMLSGIVVEPIIDYYLELVKNYGSNKNVITVNKAMHPSKERKTMYRLRKDHPFKRDLNGIGSFSLEHLLNQKDPTKTPQEWLAPNIENHIVEEDVECITFQGLINDYDVKKIDLLQIDTEGFDYEIIKMIDFDLIKPSIIRYEIANLNKNDIYNSLKHLINHKYKIYDEGNDIIALNIIQQ